jgi:hypothetical protein
MKLLTTQNAKTIKGESLGYLTGILYLAPHKIADGKTNLCPASTAGCRAACLYSAGRGAFKSIQASRIKKTKWLLRDRTGFISQLIVDIQALKRKAAREGLKPAVRLNGTSDIAWEQLAPWLFSMFSDVQFYDYTKRKDRTNLPPNYYLTQSASELDDISSILKQERNVAVVFDKLPDHLDGVIVINGMDHDLRFIDQRGVIVGLEPKGRARKDSTGFVKRGVNQ